MTYQDLDSLFRKKIEPIQVDIHQNERRLVFPEGLSLGLFDVLIESMMEKGLCFSIYDALYPSVSDPGAYFHYSPNNGTWEMSLGNHGWSDGIYTISSAVVAGQLRNLYQHHLLQELDLEHGRSHFGHPIVSKEGNSIIVNRIKRIHNQN